MNAPKLWPALPVKWISMVSSGSPSAPHRRVISLPTIVPTTRWTLRIGSMASTFSFRSTAGAQSFRSTVLSNARSRPWFWAIWQKRPTLIGTSGW